MTSHVLELRSPADGRAATAVWGLAALGLLAAGIAAFTTDPRMGLVMLGLLAAPLFVFVPELGVLLLAAVLPFDALAGVTEEGSFTLTRLIGAGLLGAWALHVIARRQRVRLGRPGLWLSGYVVFAAASTAWAVDPSLTIPALRTLVQLLFLYIVVANVVATPGALLRTLDVLIVAASVLALVILFQLPGGTTFHGRAVLTHAGQILNPNYLAAMLVFPAVAALALGRLPGGLLGSLRPLAVVPLALALFATGSRGGGVALLGGVLTVAELRPRIGVRIAAGALVVLLSTPLVPGSSLRSPRHLARRPRDGRGQPGRRDGVRRVSRGVLPLHAGHGGRPVLRPPAQPRPAERAQRLPRDPG
jgi:hypothetical protein